MIIFAAPDANVVLRSPNLGDSIRVPLGTKIHRAYNGEVYSYKKSNVKATLNLQFSYLSQQEIEGMFTFIENHVGQYLTYLDHDGKLHNVRILTSPISFQHQGRFNRGFSIELEVGDYATGNVG